MKKLLTRQEVADLLRLSIPTLYRIRQTDLEFPKPVLTSARRIAWVESELHAWIETRHA